MEKGIFTVRQSEDCKEQSNGVGETKTKTKQKHKQNKNEMKKKRKRKKEEKQTIESLRLVSRRR